jgi:hypothetical protein
MSLSLASSGNPRQPLETSAGVSCRCLQGRSKCLLPAPVATTRQGEWLVRHESGTRQPTRLCGRSVSFLQRLCRHGMVSTFRKLTGNDHYWQEFRGLRLTVKIQGSCILAGLLVTTEAFLRVRMYVGEPNENLNDSYTRTTNEPRQHSATSLITLHSPLTKLLHCNTLHQWTKPHNSRFFPVWTPKGGTHYCTPDDGHASARNMLSQ